MQAAKHKCTEHLLAVDLGVKTGLALYRSDGKLIWYRSQNFGNSSRLRKAIPGILKNFEDINYLIIEGGGPLAKIWIQEAEKRNIDILNIMAEDWRHEILLPREQRKGKQAKYYALTYAHKVINKLGLHQPTTMNNDTAEAVLIGFWGILKLGWTDNFLL